MNIKAVVLILSMCTASVSLALTDLALIYPQIEGCERTIVPVAIHTMLIEGDPTGFAAFLEREEDITYTQSVYVWDEANAFSIFVDLLQSHHGGFFRVEIMDAYNNPTWETIEKAPSFRRARHLERHVIPVTIPSYEVEFAFPRPSIYSIRVTSYPLEPDAGYCLWSAATSIMVSPTYPMVTPTFP